MNLIKVFKIIQDDKKYGSENHNDRVTKINNILKLNCEHRTKKFEINDVIYDATYKHLQFWYDGSPITFKGIWRCFGYYHVQLWECLGGGSHCGFGTGIVKGRFTKKYIYKWLQNQAKIYYKICHSDKKISKTAFIKK